jgi:hypothetical protein
VELSFSKVFCFLFRVFRTIVFEYDPNLVFSGWDAMSQSGRWGLGTYQGDAPLDLMSRLMEQIKLDRILYAAATHINRVYRGWRARLRLVRTAGPGWRRYRVTRDKWVNGTLSPFWQRLGEVADLWSRHM